MAEKGWGFVETPGLLRFVREGQTVDIFKWSSNHEKHLVVRRNWDGLHLELPYDNESLPWPELDALIEAGDRG